jgi:hypothetical protein
MCPRCTSAIAGSSSNARSSTASIIPRDCSLSSSTGPSVRCSGSGRGAICRATSASYTCCAENLGVAGGHPFANLPTPNATPAVRPWRPRSCLPLGEGRGRVRDTELPFPVRQRLHYGDGDVGVLLCKIDLVQPGCEPPMDCGAHRAHLRPASMAEHVGRHSRRTRDATPYEHGTSDMTGPKSGRHVHGDAVLFIVTAPPVGIGPQAAGVGCPKMWPCDGTSRGHRWADGPFPPMTVRCGADSEGAELSRAAGLFRTQGLFYSEIAVRITSGRRSAAGRPTVSAALPGPGIDMPNGVSCGC